jgi:hypothetical protein
MLNTVEGIYRNGEIAKSAAIRNMLAVLEELRSIPFTSEDERILDEFESFRRQHPFRLGSLEETS